MALPIIDNSVVLHIASKNVIKYIRDNEGIAHIFKIEALRQYISNAPITPIRKYDLIHILDMYK